MHYIVSSRPFKNLAFSPPPCTFQLLCLLVSCGTSCPPTPPPPKKENKRKEKLAANGYFFDSDILTCACLTSFSVRLNSRMTSAICQWCCAAISTGDLQEGCISISPNGASGKCYAECGAAWHAVTLSWCHQLDRACTRQR